MGKQPKRGLSSRERIATRVLTRLSRKRLPDHLAAPGTVHETPEIFQATVAGISKLSNLNPTHVAYVYAHNMASELAERCTAWKEMSRFCKLISRAEDMYMPGGPPLSPLTMSFFSCWSIFDACVGAANETIGTILVEFCDHFGIGNELSRLIQILQTSRMGFYINRGREGGLAILEELVTGATCWAIVPAGDFGTKGELWYVRVLPPPFAGDSTHVVFTTPYVVLTPEPREWLKYFGRALPSPSTIEDYERHMKFGPTRDYWNDFVFEAFVNYKSGGIYLAGVPDIPASRPHSAVSQSFDDGARKQ